jgi:hypothetical protein
MVLFRSRSSLCSSLTCLGFAENPLPQPFQGGCELRMILKGCWRKADARLAAAPRASQPPQSAVPVTVLLTPDRFAALQARSEHTRVAMSVLIVRAIDMLLGPTPPSDTRH